MLAKNSFFNTIFSAYYFLKVHLHHFPKIKSQKESQNSRNQGFSYYFCMMIEGSGSIPLTSGSGRPKNMWIRWIRIRNTAFELFGRRIGELGLGTLPAAPRQWGSLPAPLPHATQNSVIKIGKTKTISLKDLEQMEFYFLWKGKCSWNISISINLKNHPPFQFLI